MLLKDKLKGRRLLLASKSPRRSQLLRDCGLDFEIVDGREAEEVYPEGLAVEEVAEYLSRLKSDAYADMAQGVWPVAKFWASRPTRPMP